MQGKDLRLFSEYTLFLSIAPNVGDLNTLKYSGQIGKIEQRCRSSVRLTQHTELDRLLDVEKMHILFLQMIKQVIRLFLADDHHDFLRVIGWRE